PSSGVLDVDALEGDAHGDYPFSPVSAMPLTICFWKMRKTMTRGSMETVAAVMMVCQLLPASPEKLASPTGRVNIRGVAAAIRGQRKAFQFPMKLKIARIASAGATRGRTTVKTIPSSR